MHKKIAQELLDESTRIVENIEGMDYLSYTFSDINRINIQDDIKNIYIKESELPSESDYTIHQRTLLFSEALEDFSQQMVNKKNREKIIRLYLHFVERLVLSQDNSMIMNNLIADQMQQIFE